jgi:hypothetical protein
MRKAVAMMNCEEFELRGLDLDRADADPQEAAAAARHAQSCGRCNAMLESWREVKGDLRLLRESTRLDSAPARVEMRLKQELRTRREARVPRSTVVVASWALAATAVLVASVGWLQTHHKPRGPVVSSSNARQIGNIAPKTLNDDSDEMLLAADYDSATFTQLPASLPSASSAESILEVRMQRGALERFGLPVDPDRASEFVDVDFLVGEDGQPQAVRLHQNSQVVTATQ